MIKYLACIFIVATCSTAFVACGQQQFSGTISNGYKGDKISFKLSADKKMVTDLTFSGYWRCSGKMESITVGPDKGMPIKNGEVHAVVLDPESGGSTAWRFALDGAIKGKVASGTFRMSINNLGCDTYVLKWTANAK
jgi:hypothetical protein